MSSITSSVYEVRYFYIKSDSKSKIPKCAIFYSLHLLYWVDYNQHVSFIVSHSFPCAFGCNSYSKLMLSLPLFLKSDVLLRCKQFGAWRIERAIVKRKWAKFVPIRLCQFTKVHIISISIPLGWSRFSVGTLLDSLS